MRFAIDTGGTFTDLVVESPDGISIHKALTTPDDPVRGLLDVLGVAAAARGMGFAEFLGMGELLVHGTTRAINAILTGGTARTAYLCTAGHPDALVFREGGRRSPFDFTQVYPEPYVSRALTFEVPGRIASDGRELIALDEAAVRRIALDLAEQQIEAIGVCLLWSIVNPAHEKRIGEILAETLPGVPVTLSHVVNPIIREYRRASSTVIDASLKPLMTSYIGDLEERVRAAGFGGDLLVVTSSGGVQAAGDVAESPIHLINSGPAMAPVAGRHFSLLDTANPDAIVADTGGTTYDVSLVSDGRIPVSRETWIGGERVGHMTGFPSVDVKSVGAGGGSIAWVDVAGLLHVGPQSAGSQPGPACYARGGTAPTVTDACVVLGYLDPGYFLGGAMTLDWNAAHTAIERHIARPTGLDVYQAAEAIVQIATENMVNAIEEITIDQGVDPRTATLIAGGGAAGLNSAFIGRRLGCESVVFPQVGAVLSAAGAIMSDLTKEFAATHVSSTAALDAESINRTLAELIALAEGYLDDVGGDGTIEVYFDARYPHQVWEIPVSFAGRSIDADVDLPRLRQSFHDEHRRLYRIADTASEVEIIGWRVRASSSRGDEAVLHLIPTATSGPPSERPVYFDGRLWKTPVVRLEEIAIGVRLSGPAIVESPVTTIVVDPGATIERAPSGSLVLRPFGDALPHPTEKGLLAS